jgi:hypothetical protein
VFIKKALPVFFGLCLIHGLVWTQPNAIA